MIGMTREKLLDALPVDAKLRVLANNIFCGSIFWTGMFG
jgi:hypothetical protein